MLWRLPSRLLLSEADKPTPALSARNIQFAGQAACRNCPAGYAARSLGSIKCDRCLEGSYAAFSRSTQCTSCSPGHFQNVLGQTQCTECPVGYFQGSLNATECNVIDGGYHAPSKSSGATQQIECPPGTYSRRRALECTSCPHGWSQPEYRSTTCLKCSKGKSTLRNGSRFCVGKDCETEEYLNDTAAEFSKWKCEPCPEGAVCNAVADATWAAVVARAGFYRMPEPAPQRFIRCLKRGACLGVSASDDPPYANNVSEGCLASQGYNGMLCHACLEGFARSGQNDCLPCDAGSAVKIAVGIVVAIAVSIYFVWSTLNKNEKTLEIEICKIAMSGVQAVTVLGRYPLSWPSEVSSVLDAVGGAFSVAGDVVSFRCLMDPSNGSRYLRGSAIILASPLIACALGLLFGWRAAACRRTCL